MWADITYQLLAGRGNGYRGIMPAWLIWRSHLPQSGPLQSIVEDHLYG
jgi:hypothetical protein